MPSFGSNKFLFDKCFSTMARLTRSMTALAGSMMKGRKTIQKKPWKMTRGQIGQVTKKKEAIGVLRELTLLQNIAINQLGTISHKKSRKEASKKSKKETSKHEYVLNKKENTSRARNTKKAKLDEYIAAGMDAENAKQVCHQIINPFFFLLGTPRKLGTCKENYDIRR